jgi:16S rRNA (adenine1518-N6/adenine1519-N6)-dimethyltransferase
MQNLSDLTSFLKEIGAEPRKSLSQNFLIDGNIIRKIVRAADVQPGDLVLEIGPGPGALTSELLDAGAAVCAIEKDPLFAKALLRLQTPDRRLTVHCGDALNLPFDRIPAKKVVANLPYHITTPLLEKFFSSGFSSLTVMVQKEFAQRLKAKAGTKEYSSLTLFAQFHASIHSSFPVSSSCFYPKPSVDSTVIRLDSHAPPLADPAPFFQLVRRAFQQRRKMLSSSLQELHPADKIRAALLSQQTRIDARPEALSLDQWLRFFTEIDTQKT